VLKGKKDKSRLRKRGKEEGKRREGKRKMCSLA
jgi:hypothetical protein